MTAWVGDRVSDAIEDLLWHRALGRPLDAWAAGQCLGRAVRQAMEAYDEHHALVARVARLEATR